MLEYYSTMQEEENANTKVPPVRSHLVAYTKYASGSLQVASMESMAVLRARFLLTSGHLVATCLAKIEIEATSVAAYLSFALAVGSLFAGLDVFSPMKNAVHIFCHFLGGLLVCQMILQDLDPARYLWYEMLLAHLPTALCTLHSIAQLFVLKTAHQSY